MIKAFKYELRPTLEQQQQFAQFFGNVRFVYNWALNRKIQVYEQTNKSISQFDLMKELTQLKKIPEKEWLCLSPIHSLQRAINQVDTAFVNFFQKRANFPVFKRKHGKKSFQISDKNHIRFDFEACVVYLPKVKGVRFCRDRKIIGEIKKASVCQLPSGRYYISVIVEDSLEPEKLLSTEDNTIGIDVGLKSFAVLSDGSVFENKRFMQKSMKKLKVLQRRHERKQKGSNRRFKSKVVIAKLHEHISNQRLDFQHKISTVIAKQWNFVAMEDLNVKGMMQNGRLSKGIQDVGWFGFKEKLQYKTEWRGGAVLEIGRFQPSSKICSHCGCIKDNLQLKEREWECIGCKTIHDRDVNAAINIKKFALIKLGSEDSEPRINKARLRDASVDATV